MINRHNSLIDCRSKHCNLRYENIVDRYEIIDIGQAI